MSYWLPEGNNTSPWFTMGEYEAKKVECHCGLTSLAQNYDDSQHSDYCPVYKSWKERNENATTK